MTLPGVLLLLFIPAGYTARMLIRDVTCLLFDVFSFFSLSAAAAYTTHNTRAGEKDELGVITQPLQLPPQFSFHQ